MRPRVRPAMAIKRKTTVSEHSYNTIKQKVRASFAVSGSRFIATAVSASAEKEVRQSIEAVKAEFPDATHHAFAYRFGAGMALVERCSDDREPPGTAGPPMLQLLKKEGISDIVVVAARYFGGTRLGVGGLVRAYRACARTCLEQATLIRRERYSYYRLVVDYPGHGALERHIGALGGEIISVDYSGAVTLVVALPYRAADSFQKGFLEISRGRGRWERLPERPPGG